MFGQKPDLLESRIMTLTYGIRVHKWFLDGLHPESKKEVIAGIPRCKDVFLKFVKVNEVVKVGVKHRFPSFASLTGEQRHGKLIFFSNQDVQMRSLSPILVWKRLLVENWYLRHQKLGKPGTSKSICTLEEQK